MFHVKQNGDYMYKMIFCDLDGTLLDDNKNIPKLNIKYINKAIDKNCKFVICSGRSNMSIDYFNKYFGFDKTHNYAIAFNGAYIYRTDTKEKIVEHLLKGDLAIKVIELCRKFNVDIMIYKDEMLWFDSLTDKIKMYAKRNMVNTKIVDDIKLEAKHDISKVIIIGENNELKKVEQEIYNLGINNVLTTFFSAKNLYEFNPLGIDKGTGIEELCNILKIDLKETIAIGDNYNDLSMIKKAGVGACCFNGENGVKKYADYVTVNDNNKGAVAEVIKKFVII